MSVSVQPAELSVAEAVFKCVGFKLGAVVELGGTTVVGNIQADCLYFCEAKTTGFLS